MTVAVPQVVDDAGHRWRPEVTGAVLRVAREDYRLDLARVADRGLEAAGSRLLADRFALGVLLFTSVERQAADQGIGGAAFARLMRGADGSWDVFEALTYSFLVALAVRFPDSRLGRELRDHPDALAALLEE
ncbi:MAG: hypothetical protein C0501_17510 [Isosphaera sp.]|nr:hypothetical protein [Isosphaera sp.]